METSGSVRRCPSHNIDDYTVNWYQNPNDFKPALPKTDRLNLIAILRHKLENNLELFGEMMVCNARSGTGRLPWSFGASTDHNIYVSAGNPFNPFGTRFYHATGLPNADGTPRLVGTPADIQLLPGVGVIPRDFRATRIYVDSEAYRAIGGLRGRFGNKWEGASGILFARNSTRDEEHGAVRESRLRAALTSADPTKAYNPFNYTFKLVPQTGNTTNPYLLMVDRPYSNLQSDTEDSPGAPMVNNINRDGRTRFRGNFGATWRKDRWTLGWFTTYYGTYVDTGASTTKEIYDVLGQPEYISVYDDSGGVRRYRYLVSAFASHSAYVNYAIPRQRRGGLLSGVALRFGVTNLADIEPPLADEAFGYRRGAGTTAKVRTFYPQLSKGF